MTCWKAGGGPVGAPPGWSAGGAAPRWASTCGAGGSGLGYFDRRGRPITRSAWRHLSGLDAYGRVAIGAVSTHGRVGHVYTYWLGVARQAPRLIFETQLLPRPGGSALRWGWATEHDARLGHQQVCAWLTGTATMPAGLLPSRPR
jgi:hypothetical protein